MTRSQTPRHDYYEILNLPLTSTPTALSKQQLKVAYHKALLKHHPDKATSIAAAPAPASTHDTKIPQRPSPDRNADASPTFTIDEITAAYRTLSDPALRAEYDRVLRLERATTAKGEKSAVTAFHTGLEVVDLEDLVCEETGDGEGLLCWYRGCRCGDERGFMVTELDLEKEAEHGEVVIGCRGCSLWMKILFAMEEGDG
ncbi:diphthamide biosynthesis protein 4 [Aspergillus thermomutatus]|uniref:Diphthamide biosynthesis protein 4 n=1 Tax=Aspergillus thermomutatus TaxID=41047 RepID=A0A397H7N1_ASPTH|nr:Diphthamide biosynthesis protein 4 [Aspergillus thermomutatus]RHZ57694.1 Diphthamide biosynthesis protein 4 [Aspergillus thermomutatus]